MGVERGQRSRKAAAGAIEQIARNPKRAAARNDMRRLVGEELCRIDAMQLERGALASTLAHFHAHGFPPGIGHGSTLKLTTGCIPV
jgi:hypothetical protein